MERSETDQSNSEERLDTGLFGQLPDDPPAWTPATQRALDRAIGHGVPSDAVALFSRWWQLETWLRLLVYLEMRAAVGSRWLDIVPERGQSRAERDLENRYMPSADATNPLSYLDAGQLIERIGSEDIWPLVEYALLKRERWEGLVDQLQAIRNRLAHLRRPHSDDLARVEQALRDLEPGARLALESFNRQHRVWDESEDPLAKTWVRGEHQDARRLLRHAERNYDTGFQIDYSLRPWASPVSGDAVTGMPGVLIHATWFLRDGALLAPRAFWSDARLDTGHARELIVVVAHSFESTVSVTFSGVDDPDAIADAIGSCFDVVLSQRERHPSDLRRRRWRIDAQGLDWRVHVDTALVLATEDQPFSIFGA
ncbi:MAG: hypothetical protein AABM41_00245 [Chloroflexota bacterium]